MPGSFQYTPPSVPLSRPSTPIGVFRYDEGQYELLPNILALSIQFKEGADPGVARFRYDFGDPLGDGSAPGRFEEVYPLDATGRLVISNDDRIVVKRMRGDGSTEILFDGFAQVPQVDLDADTETVTFTALGTPIREWDTPISGALMRDADTPDTSGNDIQTGLPARFNPDGKPNASPGDPRTDDPDTGGVDESTKALVGISDKDSGEGTQDSPKYPVFLGPVWPKNEINDERIRPWDLGMASRYILARGNPDQDHVRHGDLTNLDVNLQVIVPAEAEGAIDLEDDGTFRYEPIIVQDYDVTGEAWPVALERLLSPHGFMFRFVLEDHDDAPQWRISIYRKDENLSIKTLKLQPAGETLDPGKTNVGALHLARDAREIVNAFRVDTAPTRIEASFVLAPGFVVAGGDTSSLNDFIEGGETFTGDNIDKYRLYVMDECGEGHWDFGSGTTVETPGDLGPVLTMDAEERPFVNRRRPGRRTLISKDDLGKPFRAKLHVSSDYDGAMPGVWDGTSGTWQEIIGGEWELLHDRLGIRVTADNPNSWSVGKPATGTDTAYPSGGKLSLVEWNAAPTSTYPYPRFRLTCVIDADTGIDAVSHRRGASPTEFAVGRRIDARDRFEKRIVSRYSTLALPLYIGPNGIDRIAIDDTDDAQALCDGMRRAHELGSFAGSVMIPRLTTAYKVGDKIEGIEGRQVSLQVNAGAEQDETPIYPTVVGVSWELDGRQMTVLELSDVRAEPAPERMESRDD